MDYQSNTILPCVTQGSDDEEEEDDPEDEEGEEYVPTPDEQEKQAEWDHLSQKHSVQGTMNKLQLKRRRKRKKEELSAKEIKKYKDVASKNMAVGQNLNDCALVFLSCVTSKETTTWEKKCSTYFSVRKALNLHPFDSLSSMGSGSWHAYPGKLEKNRWKVPQVSNVPAPVRIQFLQGYEDMMKEWGRIATGITKRMKYNIVPEGREEECIELARSGRMGSLASFKAIFLYCPKILNRLWYSWPESEEMDVRDDILRWMASNLQETTSEKVFAQLISQKADEQLAKKVKMASGVLPVETPKPIPDDPKPKKPIKKKRKTNKPKASDDPSEETKEPMEEEDKPLKEPIVIPKKPKPLTVDDVLKKVDSYAGREWNKEDSRKCYRQLCANDEGLVDMLLQFEYSCRKSGRRDFLKHAIVGVTSDFIEETYKRRVPKDIVLDLKPPEELDKTEEITLAFSDGEEGFSAMAREMLFTMNVFLQTLDGHNVAPLRWNWDYELMKGYGLLEGDALDDLPKTLLASLVCLILSCATNDIDCIGTTIQLAEKGLLDVHKLHKISKEDLQKLIRGCGIDDKRVKYIKEMAETVINVHGGIVPTDMKALAKLKCVGRKTSLLLVTETLGMFAGIPTDKHVLHACICYGLMKCRKPDPLKAESSIRTWVPQHRWSQVNRIFGSFAQVFTNELKTIKTEEHKELCRVVMESCTDYMHKPVHIEMLFCCIKLVRSHYFN